jgi:hypothetical protein
VAGGYTNVVSGTAATVPGGAGNTAAGDYSFAAGWGAQAMHDGTFVWADSQGSTFTSTGDDQFLVRARGGVTLETSGAGVWLGAGPLYVDKISSVGDPLELQTDDITRIYIDDTTGQVGIGTSSPGPTATLDVSGTVRANVVHIDGGADLAEPFEVVGRENVEPGMVVSIDAEHPGQLRIADQAYDRMVIGIVSGANGLNPGIVMQQDGMLEGSFPVALSGRVYALADASYGAIQPGDLLTTSDTPGHVRKVTDYENAHGAIVGKAMTALDGGQGLILIVVMPH